MSTKPDGKSIRFGFVLYSLCPSCRRRAVNYLSTFEPQDLLLGLNAEIEDFVNVILDLCQLTISTSMPFIFVSGVLSLGIASVTGLEISGVCRLPG